MVLAVILTRLGAVAALDSTTPSAVRIFMASRRDCCSRLAADKHILAWKLLPRPISPREWTGDAVDDTIHY
jgi:hypothetical protein